MSSSEEDSMPPMGNGSANSSKSSSSAPKNTKNNKRLSVERIYQKKSQLEHILLRPDTYIGSVQSLTESNYVIQDGKVLSREITFVPGLYKIFDEILVNAADNKQRDPKMDTIKVDIDPEKNEIKVFNNGKGIPVVQHKDEKMYVPTMIFGHLLTSSNFNDEEQKVTGGRNGFGAKLCNVFSTKFTVETASKEYKKVFKQVWGANMSRASEPKISPYSGEDFTRVTFNPDLDKFHMSSLDANTVALLSRRAYDVAASSKGVKVYLNGKRIPIKGFKEYVDFFIKSHEEENPGSTEVKPIFEVAGPRWEVAVAVSESGFKQMSFVNSIATTKGGRHVDHVTDLVTKALGETLKKKNKGGISIKPFQIKNHLWIFVNCLIVNPTFDSQTKENMTLQVKSFGSKCVLSDKFTGLVAKSGIVEAVLAWSKFKQDQMLKKNTSGKKTSKLKGIPKLEDANDAGTRNSTDCTLILTEGDSAKTLAVSGLSVVGRDKYGVYPLRGKLLNVREATHKQLLENKEINELVKIMGLTYKKKYESDEDMKSLRYGKIMIMTDQDQDGSHIKGLIINFIHHNWPTLLRRPFLEEFITPIVKASKGANASFSFYSLPEFEEWKGATPNWTTYKIKYYKGLGTSTSKEAKEYFSDMRRHRILFSYNGQQDDHCINMAFSKKAVEERKDWLTNWMQDCKRRKELGMSEIFLYEKNTRSVTYSDFVNKELVLFSNLDNERSIPSLVDGFKPGQRKVVFTCLKRNDKREVKVAQLAGSVGEMSAYHHGEASLMGTIINLAQNYVGSNNINLLQPIGQFGTRLAGGKDHASPRYIFTQLSPLTRFIYHIHDDYVLKYLRDDNLKVEPEYYVPILPMVLINGADGIGTGWMTKIPNFNPKDVVENILRLMDGKEMKELTPWFKHFKGTIEGIGENKYVVNGEIANLSDTKLEVTELPIRTWTQNYKESVMEPMLNGNEKNHTSLITDYKEYHTDVTVKFVISMAQDKLREAEIKGLHQFFKIQTTISTSSMVLFDANGCLQRYNSALDIIKEFYGIRLRFYEKRKKYLVGLLEAENLRLKNQARFIKMKCDGSLVVENKPRKEIIGDLIRKGFDSDPIKAWKSTQELEEEEEEDGNEDEDVGDREGEDNKKDYDYLMSMAMWSLTKERKNELLRKAQEKQDELDAVKAISEKEMWRKDLREFDKKYDEIMRQEKEEMAKLYSGGTGGKKGGSSKSRAILASPHGIRVAPRIDEELRTKVARAAAAKDKKAKKVPKSEEGGPEVPDEFDNMVPGKNDSLAAKVGKKAPKAPKRTSPKKASKKRDSNPWDSSDNSGAGSVDEDIELSPVKERSKRNVKSKKYSFSDDEAENSDKSDMELFDNEAIKEAPLTKRTLDVSDTDEDDDFGAPKNGNHSSEDEFDAMIKSTSAPEATAPSKKASRKAAPDSDNSEDAGPAKKVPKKAAPAKKPPKKQLMNIDNDEEDDFISSKKPKGSKKAAAPRKKKKNVSSDEDAIMNSADEEEVAPVQRPGRSKAKAVSYNFDDSD